MFHWFTLFGNGLEVLVNMFNPMNWLNGILNFFIDLIYLIVRGLVAILPQTPFQFDSLDWGPFGTWVGGFLPVSQMFLHFSAITTSILIYYAIRHILRLMQMVQ